MMKEKTICTLTALGLALLVLAGCAGESTPEPSQAPSAAPTQSEAPSAAPEQSQGSEPTAKPSEAPSVEPTAAPESSAEPTDTPDPTKAPEPTPTPKPTATPEPAPQGPEDGNYTANVTLSGGTGRASVQSPATLRCANGQFFATIVWSSFNYDYMKVNGVRYDPISSPWNGSTFEIPVAAFDTPLPVIADTVAMSEPHEVEYTLTFDSASLAKQ